MHHISTSQRLPCICGRTLVQKICSLGADAEERIEAIAIADEALLDIINECLKGTRRVLAESCKTKFEGICLSLVHVVPRRTARNQKRHRRLNISVASRSCASLRKRDDVDSFACFPDEDEWKKHEARVQRQYEYTILLKRSSVRSHSRTSPLF